jgi:hypothetical protein
MMHNSSRRRYASVDISYKYGPDAGSYECGPVTGLYKYVILYIPCVILRIRYIL